MKIAHCHIVLQPRLSLKSTLDLLRDLSIIINLGSMQFLWCAFRSLNLKSIQMLRRPKGVNFLESFLNKRRYTFWMERG